jgi:ribonuclease E
MSEPQTITATEADHGPEDEGPEDEAASSPEQRPGPAAATADGAERRRRRRRRGRRGRRFEPEGSPVIGAPEIEGGYTPPIAAADLESSAPMQEFVAPPIVFEQPRRDIDVPVSVNTPSSPVWTLLDQQTVQELPAPMAESEPVNPPVDTVAATKPAVLATEEPPAVDATPKEIRRGWWQRRFKD